MRSVSTASVAAVVRRSVQGSTVLLTFGLCLAVLSAPALGQASAPSQVTPQPLPLVFWEPADMADPVGRIEFDAHALEPEPPTTGYPNMLYGCEAPRDAASVWVYGWELRNWSDRPNRAMAITRCATADGRAFVDVETVLVHTNKDWQGFVNLVRRPTDGALFCFSWAPGALHVFRSAEGTSWQLLTSKAYSDHDAMCIRWDFASGQFLNYQTTLERFNKRYPDNIGNFRRVLSFRRSPDGVNWESFSPPFLQGALLWRPDAEDPVDLEFYRVVVFPHHSRWAMLVVDYVPPPPEANSRRATTKHGPRYLTEWAVSRDGLNWQRPFRHRDALEKVIWAPVQGPLVRHGVLRFYERDGKCAGLPADRLFYATCRANGEFSTPVFTMPANGLALNADARWRPGENPGQAYLMAELRDKSGAVLPGYERARCLFENTDGHALPLRWEQKTGAELAGRPVSLRLYLRDARVYGLLALGPAGSSIS